MQIKNKGSRNALKHGLAAQLWTQDDQPRIATLAEMLESEGGGEKVEQAVKRAAKARAYLERVMAVRDEILAVVPALSEVTFVGGAALDRFGELATVCGKLNRLERYERQATLQWERALAELELAHFDE